VITDNRQGDLFLYHTQDGGEIDITCAGEPVMTGGLDSAVYLSLFAHEGTEHWINEYATSDEKISCQFYEFIKANVKTAKNIQRAIDLVENDLAWIKSKGIADVIDVSIVSNDIMSVTLVIDIKKNGDTLFNNEYGINWMYQKDVQGNYIKISEPCYVEPPAPIWLDVTDDSYWSIHEIDMIPIGTWDGIKWSSVSQEPLSSNQAICLDELGVWVEGYRPTKMRITFDGVATALWVELWNGEGWAYSTGAYEYTSELEVDLDWSHNHDITFLYCWSETVEETFNITKIEFFPIP
jgi:phage gp46-like protein